MTVSARDRLLNEHEAWRKHQELIADADSALQKIREQATKENRERAELERQHREAVTAAAMNGDEVPADLPPPSQGLVDATRMAMQRSMNLLNASPGVIAGIAPAVEARAQEEHDRIVGEVQDAVNVLEAKSKEMTELLRVVTECRAAVESQGPRRHPSPSSQTRPNISAAELVDAVRHRTNVLAPLPSLGLGGRVMVDRALGFHEPAGKPRQPVPSRGRQV